MRLSLSRYRRFGFSLRNQGLFFFLLALSFYFFPESAQAAKENQDLHWSGTKTIWDRKRNIVELEGNASVTQPGETVTADFIRLDLNDRTIEARGNCNYAAREVLVQADELYFNLDTRTGSVIRGRVIHDNFSLLGERINKLGETRFQTHKGQYSTCRDCPNSWSILGEDVDVQLEGYAFMSDVAIKVKDAPVLWLPYLIVPVKTKRQTGLLFPRFGFSGVNGVTFMQPFFWAINRSVDMTIGLGNYSKKGRRIEWEGRYALSPRSTGTANFYSQRDSSAGALRLNRFGFKSVQTQELPFKIDEKLRFREVSDNNYPIDFPEDMPGLGDSVLASDLIFSRASPTLSSYLAIRRYRNLLNDKSQADFDRNTVQQFPYALLTTNDQIILNSPVAAGLTLGVANFSRTAGTQDYDLTSTPGSGFRPGIDPVREATRVSMVPSLYTTLHPFGMFTLVPSLDYRAFFYSFHNTSGMRNLARGYLIFQTEASAQWEKVYETDNPEMPRIKHLIRPTLSYSRIPFTREPRHPFISQVAYRGGYKFDNYDVVPVSNSPSTVNYFTPLGHSVSYGLTTQLIRREGRIGQDDFSYRRNIELKLGQTFNILELQKPQSQQVPLTRLFSALTLDFKKFTSTIDYYYYPYLGRILAARDPASRPTWSPSPHEGSASFSYQLERKLHNKVFLFERSLTMAYSFSRIDSNVSNVSGGLTYSFNDYFMPSFRTSYDFLTHTFFQNNLDLAFQSPSQCWKVVASLGRYIARPGWDFHFDFSLNLTGESFGGFSELSQKQGGGV